MIAALAVAAVAVREPGPLDVLVVGLAAAGVVAVTAGVAMGWAAWGPLAAGLLGAGFVSSLYERPAVLDGATPLVAAGLLLVAEATAWSAEARMAGGPGQPAASRAAVLIGAVAAALLASVALAAVVALPVGRDLSLGAVGAGAVALVAGVLLATARGGSDPP